MFILPKGGSGQRALRGCRNLLIILLLIAVTCANTKSESSMGDFFSIALPDVQWKLEGKPYRYIPQNLYEYINGAAEFFIAFGFVELAGANYAPVAGDKDSVTIDIYNMGSKLSAFGVFRSRRDRQASSLNLGAAATVSDDYIAFHKDRFYVEIQALIINTQAKNVIAGMASNVAEHLPGENTLPQELSYFSEEGRIVGSERYIRGGVLGHAFLEQGIVCDYQIEGKKVTAFIAMLPSDQAAVEAIEQHRSFLEKSGQKCLPLDGLGAHAFASEEPYHQKIIETQQGPFVIGVYDLDSAAAGKILLVDILKNIKPESCMKIDENL